ncbi:hypothetical protein [Streptomyces sp. LN325]|uniref:hypothetical protein n=1 Tax=Streptomyces sp. LN325 TaxID=3112976 RepID=UPI0037237D69
MTTKYRGIVIREPDILRAIAAQSGWPAGDAGALPGVPTPRAPRPPRPKRAPLEPPAPHAGPASGLDARAGGTRLSEVG